jgi:gas vesicle protein
MATHEGGGGGYLVAFVLGALAGAAVALLWAPASGEDTRRRLAETAREGRRRASEAARTLAEVVESRRKAPEAEHEPEHE